VLIEAFVIHLKAFVIVLQDILVMVVLNKILLECEAVVLF